jgi:hypothetical protein
LLAAIPKTSVVEIAWELKFAESHQAELKFNEDDPEAKGFE